MRTRKSIYNIYTEHPFLSFITVLEKASKKTTQQESPKKIIIIIRKIFKSEHKSTELVMEQLVQNWERSTIRLYIVTRLI